MDKKEKRRKKKKKKSNFSRLSVMGRGSFRARLDQIFACDLIGSFRTDTTLAANSKHWFTTSFLQPLPYLVMPQGPENCQLTSSFFFVFFCCCFFWAQTGKLVTNKSNYIRRLFYNWPHRLRLHHIAYASSNKTRIVWIETETSCLRAWALGCFYSHISTQIFRSALTASVDTCAEIKSAPSVA